MFIARCQSCGTVYYGCALRYLSELSCTSCGSTLVVTGDGDKTTSRENTKDTTISPTSNPRI